MSLVAAAEANAAVNPIDIKVDSDPSITDYGTDADTKPFDSASESKLSHRRHQLQTSSVPPSLAAAFCQLALEADPQDHGVLHLPDDANVPDLLLKPWQVNAVAWMLRQKASPLHGGILADACGLGNTITALATIVLGNRLPSAEVSPRFAATLIIVPNTLIDTWFMEIRRRFGSSLRVILFYGSSDRCGDPIRTASTISSLNALVDLLAGLSPLDESTGRTVVLSSYSTWSCRTTTQQSVSTEKPPAAKPKPPKAPRPD
ncbi:Helicase C-terminal [Penicillium brevicompactum]|uniref:Helicase C-terminal n=1 Tax=Penicillium brevicompactum TaxID=5074 RepID=A0A9W9V342_PENBR|nr:Helicase C-terminal [Penicillium brevicompactum]